MKHFSKITVFLFGVLAGCTSVEVQAVAQSNDPIRVVYIQRNPVADEIAPDLESAIESGLQRHGIGTRVIAGEPSGDSEYSLNYTATGGWDLKPFMKTAEVRLKRGPRQIGYVRYENAGGLNTSKYASARAKLDPLLDQLLCGFH
jgi:hypothetical protein